MNKKTTLWFTRQNGSVKGPFTVSAIKNNLRIKRLNSSTDEVSTDQVNWKIIYSEAVFNLDSHSPQAKRQLDERNGFDRRNPQLDEKNLPHRRDGDRREIESESDIKSRQFRTLLMYKFRHQKQHIFGPLLTFFVALIIIMTITVLYSTPIPSSDINCNLPASENVNWNNCLKPRLDLRNIVLSNSQLRNSQLIGSNLMNTVFNSSDMAYSDLRFTNLSYSQLNNTLLLGANLRNADLSYADLTDADLSYADLTDANLGGSKLKNTRFDHAIWTNGQQCLVDSIDRCITASE